MRTIKLFSDGEIAPRDIIQKAVSSSRDGMDVQEMRRRMRVLDALDAAENDVFEVEDADYEVLLSAVRSFPFAIAHHDILRTVDAIEAAAST